MKNADEVLARIKLAMGARHDAEIFDPLDVKRSTVSSWRTRDSVPDHVLERVAREWDVSMEWLRQGSGDMRIEERPPIYKVGEAQAAGDARLAAVLAWWRHFWEISDEDERVWALVQLKRAIPESEGWIRRWIQDHDAGG